MRRNRTSLSSKRVRHSGPSRDVFGRKIQPTREVLGPKAMEKKAADAREKRKARLNGKFVYLFVQLRADNLCTLAEMTPDQRHALEALQELPIVGDDDDKMDLGHITLEDILDGSEPLDISHAGGEFAALTKELKEGLKYSLVAKFNALRLFVQGLLCL